MPLLQDIYSRTESATIHLMVLHNLFTIAMLIMDTILSYMYSVTMVLLFFILLLLLRLYSTSAEGL